MGKVLAMRRTVCAALCALLVGCGNDREWTIFDNLLESGLPVGGGGEAQGMPDPRALAKAGMAQIQEPLMIAVLEDREAVALMVPFGENRGVRTWTTIERQTVALSSGRVVATRGLGNDLMSAEGPKGTSGRYTRVLRTINSANEPVEVRLTCQATAEGARETVSLMSGQDVTLRRVTENCTGAEAPVQNLFWFASDGSVRQSRQWVGPDAGYLVLQVLRQP